MKFYHWQPYDQKGGVTLAYEVENKFGKALKLTFSICSKHDQFCKRIGREKALSHADRYFTIPMRGSLKQCLKRLHGTAFNDICWAISNIHGH